MDYMEVTKMISNKIQAMPTINSAVGHVGIQEGVFSIDRALTRLSIVLNTIIEGTISNITEPTVERPYLSLADMLNHTPNVLEGQAKELHRLINAIESSLFLNCSTQSNGI